MQPNDMRKINVYFCPHNACASQFLFFIFIFSPLSKWNGNISWNILSFQSQKQFLDYFSFFTLSFLLHIRFFCKKNYSCWEQVEEIFAWSLARPTMLKFSISVVIFLLFFCTDHRFVVKIKIASNHYFLCLSPSLLSYPLSVRWM